MSESAIVLLDPVRDRAEALVSRFDSLICPASMERARTWLEAGLKASLDLYRDMAFAELIDAFPGGRVIMAEIVETAGRLKPSWSQVLAPVPAGYQAARLRSRRISGGDRQHGDRREAHGRLRRDPSRGSERSVEPSGSRRPKGQGLG